MTSCTLAGETAVNREDPQMAYEVEIHAQDTSSGRVGEVLNGIAAAAAGAGSYATIDAAVAYARAG